MEALDRDQGRYRIQAVARLTSVPAATLRSWERRYGVPAPERTAAGYRLYSKADVDLVRRVRDLISQGLSASEAADAARAQAAATPSAPRMRPAPEPVTAGDESVDGLVAAVRRFDLDAVRLHVDRAFSQADASSAFEGVVGPALVRVGELWALGEVTVAQEHMLSTLVRDALSIAQPPSPVLGVVLACVAEEQHSLGLLGVGLKLATWGIRPLYLGQRTPPDAVAHAVTHLRPAAVGLSATITRPPRVARPLFAAYGEACGELPWFVGGAAAAPMEAAITAAGGQVVAEDLGALRDALRDALRATGRPVPLP